MFASCWLHAGLRFASCLLHFRFMFAPLLLQFGFIVASFLLHVGFIVASCLLQFSSFFHVVLYLPLCKIVKNPQENKYFLKIRLSFFFIFSYHFSCLFMFFWCFFMLGCWFGRPPPAMHQCFFLRYVSVFAPKSAPKKEANSQHCFFMFFHVLSCDFFHFFDLLVHFFQ